MRACRVCLIWVAPLGPASSLLTQLRSSPCSDEEVYLSEPPSGDEAEDVRTDDVSSSSGGVWWCRRVAVCGPARCLPAVALMPALPLLGFFYTTGLRVQRGRRGGQRCRGVWRCAEPGCVSTAAAECTGRQTAWHAAAERNACQIVVAAEGAVEQAVCGYMPLHA